MRLSTLTLPKAVERRITERHTLESEYRSEIARLQGKIDALTAEQTKVSQAAQPEIDRATKAAAEAMRVSDQANALVSELNSKVAAERMRLQGEMHPHRDRKRQLEAELERLLQGNA